MLLINEKENKNIIEQRIKEDEFEKIDKFQMDNSIRMVLKEFLNYWIILLNLQNIKKMEIRF